MQLHPFNKSLALRYVPCHCSCCHQSELKLGRKLVEIWLQCGFMNNFNLSTENEPIFSILFKWWLIWDCRTSRRKMPTEHINITSSQILATYSILKVIFRIFQEVREVLWSKRRSKLLEVDCQRQFGIIPCDLKDFIPFTYKSFKSVNSASIHLILRIFFSFSPFLDSWFKFV